MKIYSSNIRRFKGRKFPEDRIYARVYIVTMNDDFIITYTLHRFRWALQIADEFELYLNPLCMASGQGRCPVTWIKRLHFALSPAACYQRTFRKRWNQLRYSSSRSLTCPSSFLPFPSPRFPARFLPQQRIARGRKSFETFYSRYTARPRLRLSYLFLPSKSSYATFAIFR